MDFVKADGGRSKYFKGQAGDCVVRAIANATGKDYLEIYNAINELAKKEKVGKRKKGVSSARNGVYKNTSRKYLQSIGWKYIPTMAIGSGCTTRLRKEDLPGGTIIVQVSHHFTCVKDGVIYDTHDCSREEKRCVYGYYKKAQ
ncbi:MAG: hypothetical protein EOM23_01625 [Candidatus Moranbacteria bacterium]|nr:hypothetical protein [Candidatus Moranbacteria bacterium]